MVKRKKPTLMSTVRMVVWLLVVTDFQMTPTSLASALRCPGGAHLSQEEETKENIKGKGCNYSMFNKVDALSWERKHLIENIHRVLRKVEVQSWELKDKLKKEYAIRDFF